MSTPGPSSADSELQADEPEQLRFGGFTLDTAGHVLIDPGHREVPLRRSEFKLLLAFLRAPGRVLSRERLLDAVAGRRATPYDRSIDVLVGQLRRKIEPERKFPRLILTVPGAGYKFAAKSQAVPPPSEATPNAAPRKEPQAWPQSAERRRLTIMLCGIAGSSALSAQLDPEELQPPVAGFQRCCSDVIARGGGMVANLQGDNVLAYFGYPEAHEHDAERAARAGLAIIEAVSKLDAHCDTPVRARVGIATGPVVVGDTVGEEAASHPAALGEASSLVTHLLSAGAPDAVTISAECRRLVGRLFDYQPLGPVALEGCEETVAAFRVTGEAAAESRFEAMHEDGLTPLVGRAEEMALLLRRWQQAKAGAGKLILIGGEAGIGKSRLVRELRTRLSHDTHTALTCFCAPHQQDSAYHPFLSHIAHAAGFARGDGAAERLAKLEELLGQTGTGPEAIALLADLLSVSTQGRYPLPNLSPHRRRERTAEALIGQVVAVAARGPVLLAVEDVHWIDPTSREVLDRLIDRIVDLPVLLVITFRPDFSPPWTSRAQATTVMLNGLDRAQAAELIEHVSDGTVPETVRNRIVERTDGVPLFVEELTMAVVQRGASATLPASLHDSLMARLDRVPSAKAVAQFGSVIGRSFSHQLVAALTDQPEAALSEALDQLISSGLASRRGTGPDATYTFKHALVRDAAYESLLKSRRAAIHGQVVEALIADEPNIEKAQPELLARHCEQAGLAEKAASYFIRAGWLSQYRAAYEEASEQFTEVLRLISVIPEGAVRDLMELRARRGIGLTIGNSAGYASPESGANMFRAAELCEHLDYPPEFAGIGWGLHVFLIQRGELARALEVGEHLLRWGHAQDDIRGRVLGHLCAGSVAVVRGELATARMHLQQAVDLYQSSLDDPTVDWTYRTATSGPGVWGNSHGRLAWIQCWTGYPDRAIASISESDQYDEPEIIVIREAISGWRRLFTLSFLVEPSDLSSSAETLIRHSRKHGLPLFAALGTIIQGCAIARGGDPEAGRTVISEGLAAYTATEAVLFSCYFRALLAEAHQMLGETDAALSILTDALALTEQTGEQWYLAELHRRVGDVRRQQGDDDVAEQCFRRAVAVARSQGAKLWELQAATSYARMLRNQGRQSEASALLAPVYGWFTEGFDTVPLRAAKALLEDLYQEEGA